MHAWNMLPTYIRQSAYDNMQTKGWFILRHNCVALPHCNLLHKSAMSMNCGVAWKLNSRISHYLAPSYGRPEQGHLTHCILGKSWQTGRCAITVFTDVMTKWWKCSVDTGWPRRVTACLHEFCLVTPCIIFVSPWICDQILRKCVSGANSLAVSIIIP